MTVKYECTFLRKLKCVCNRCCDLSPITELKTQQRKRKHRRSVTSKQLILNQHTTKKTPDLTWFGNVPASTGRRGEIFIQNREENTRVTKILSYNSQWQKSLFLDTPSKGHPQRVYISTQDDSSPTNFNNPISTASDKERNPDPI